MKSLFKNIWQDLKIESLQGLSTLLYFFVLLGLFLLAISVANPRL